MHASTIAEFFIDERGVRVELEIGPADFALFTDLLPADLRAALAEQGQFPRGESTRERRARDADLPSLALLDDAEKPLQRTIELSEIRRRVVRDEVTGEPLPVQPEDAELVVHAVLSFSWRDLPQRLTIRPPLAPDDRLAAATIGFVCYHNGLPVNDFRYLPGSATVELDWNDAWYSRFEHPNLARQFKAPVSVFLYVEPYEVRKEIIVRPRDLESWVDLGIGASGTIAVERQAELKNRVAEFLASRGEVLVEGKPVPGRLDRIHFIRRTLRSTGIVDPPEDLDAASATLGVIFVYPIAKLPEQASLRWDLFTPRIQEIPAVASDEAGGLPSLVTPGEPVLEWRNYLTNPDPLAMATVRAPPARRRLTIPVVSAICAFAAMGLILNFARQWKARQKVAGSLLWSLLALAAIAALAMPYTRIDVSSAFATPPQLSAADAPGVLRALLYNVYRAFDYREENLIYDRLARSISGDLLSKVYLETRASMEVKNQGGLRISVKDVTVEETKPAGSTADGGSVYQCRWQVAGSVGHWGHIHRRINQQEALIGVALVDDQWKISSLDVLDQQRIESPN